MKIHVEVWLAAATLHENGHEVTTTRQLQDEVRRLFGDVRPGVTTHISAHANASLPKGNEVVYNYLFRVEPGLHRLCRVGDPVHASRVGHPMWPDQADVDERFWPLWRKWVAWQQKGGSHGAEVAVGSAVLTPDTGASKTDIGSAAERLAAYVRSLPDFTMVPSPAVGYDHMGAIIADAVLQAGINYQNVVWPRVERLKQEHPEARTTSGFAELLRHVDAATLLDFRGTKAERVEALTRFLLDEKVEREADLKVWLSREDNLDRLRKLPGMGPKTVDYLRILAGLDTSAIDRHLALFLQQAGITADTYEERKAVIDAAAGMLGVDRAKLDYSIWKYMADRSVRKETDRSDETEMDGPVRERGDAACDLHSRYVKAMLEHLLIGELMRKSWPKLLEVYKPKVNTSGVDVVLVRDGVARYVQFKATRIGGATDAVNVHPSLWTRPESCVIWTWYDPETLEFEEFLWLGEPGQLLPPLDEVKVAGDTSGYKEPVPDQRVAPKKWFKQLTSVEELLQELFGSQTC